MAENKRRAPVGTELQSESQSEYESQSESESESQSDYAGSGDQWSAESNIEVRASITQKYRE